MLALSLINDYIFLFSKYDQILKGSKWYIFQAPLGCDEQVDLWSKTEEADQGDLLSIALES